ncbi:MAG: hypothetical protein ACK4NA_12855 [Alphaproteobacteria bacterium]
MPALDGPPFPDRLDYLWRWFVDIHQGRSGMGPGAATHADIYAWSRLNRVRLEAWELLAIQDLGRAYLRAMTETISSPAR